MRLITVFLDPEETSREGYAACGLDYVDLINRRMLTLSLPYGLRDNNCQQAPIPEFSTFTSTL